MASFTRFFVALAFCVSLFTVVTSSPAFGAKAGKTVSLPVAHNADLPRHGPTDYLRTLKKYKLKIPDGLQEVVDAHKATHRKAVDAEIGEWKKAHDFQKIWTPITNHCCRRLCSCVFA